MSNVLIMKIKTIGYIIEYKLNVIGRIKFSTCTRQRERKRDEAESEILYAHVSVHASEF